MSQLDGLIHTLDPPLSTAAAGSPKKKAHELPDWWPPPAPPSSSATTSSDRRSDDEDEEEEEEEEEVIILPASLKQHAVAADVVLDSSFPGPLRRGAPPPRARVRAQREREEFFSLEQGSADP